MDNDEDQDDLNTVNIYTNVWRKGEFMQPFWKGSGVSTMMSVNIDIIFIENPDNRELQIWSRTENGWDLKITPGTKERRGFRKKNHLSKTSFCVREIVFKLMLCAFLCSIRHNLQVE